MHATHVCSECSSTQQVPELVWKSHKRSTCRTRPSAKSVHTISNCQAHVLNQAEEPWNLRLRCHVQSKMSLDSSAEQQQRWLGCFSHVNCMLIMTEKPVVAPAADCVLEYFYCKHLLHFKTIPTTQSQALTFRQILGSVTWHHSDYSNLEIVQKSKLCNC